MPKNSPVGLSLEDAFAEAMSEVGDPFTSSPKEVTPPAAEGALSTEHPAGQSEDDRDVNLFDALDDTEDTDSEASNTDIDDSTSFTVDGSSVTFDELKKGYLRQSDYTKKTQELAEERESLKDAQALWDAMNSDPVGTLRQLQQAVNRGGSIAPKAPEKPSTTEDLNALVEARVQEMLSSDPRISAWEQSQSAAAEASAFSAVEQDFGIELTAADKARVKGRISELGLQGDNAIRLVTAALLAEVQAKKSKFSDLAAVSTAKGRFGSPQSKTDAKIPESIFEAFQMEQAEAGRA